MPTCILRNLRFAALGALLVSLAAQEPTPLLTHRPEAALIAVLNSGASTKEKMDACRELGIVGTRNAVPVLAGLFADEQLSHMARYALETMVDPSASDALRAALPRLSGRQQVGVIDSLGVRRDAKAVGPLEAYLLHTDNELADAAARALGSIGTPAASKALQKALVVAPAARQVSVCEGLLRCAEALSVAGNRSTAVSVYRGLRERSGLPHQVRAAALRGSILADSRRSTELLQQALRERDYVLFAVANRTALELGSSAVTAMLVDELKRLPVERRVVLIQTLGRRGDPACLSALATAAQNGDKAIRLAAIKALPELRTAATAGPLCGLLMDPDREIAQTALDGVAAVPGPEVDKAVMGMLERGDAAGKAVALELIGRRRMVSAVPALLQSARDTDTKVRAASYKRLGELGEAAQVGPLLELLAASDKTTDIEGAGQALATICAEVTAPESVSLPLVEALKSSKPPQQRALLGVLAGVGGEGALHAVQEAAASGDSATRSAALRSLESWRTADAVPVLLPLAQASNDSTEKLLCLRGYFRWAASAELPTDRRLAMCRDAAGLVRQTEEKRLLLGALGGIKVPEAVPLIAAHLNDAGVADEASAALVSVAAELLKGDQATEHGAALVEPLQKAAAGGNADLVRQAKRLLEKIGAANATKN